MKSIPKINLFINHIVLFISLLFLIFGLSNGMKSLSFYFFGEKLTAKVIVQIDIEDKNYITYEYEYNGNKYTSDFNNLDNKYKKGDTLTVYVNKTNPEESLVLSWNFTISLIFIIVSLPVFVIYLVIIIKYYRFIILSKKAINLNKPVKCLITDVIIKENKELSGTIPFIIKCENDNKQYQSNLIYCEIKNPESIINYSINVYRIFNLSKEIFYYVDIDSIERVDKNGKTI